MDKLDNTLQTHFREREDVPLGVKNALRAKLHDSLQQQEKLRFIWLLVPCILFAIAAIFFVVEMFFGMSIAVAIRVGYYFVATLAGIAVLIFMLVAKKFQTLSIGG